mmetsp:Transcript_73743/g.159603  ORF Transcript_73743/g.159603 Transcript_73743/m.159603 type:complete len:235 (+) Transcript_73743:220-924(+)
MRLAFVLQTLTSSWAESVRKAPNPRQRPEALKHFVCIGVGMALAVLGDLEGERRLPVFDVCQASPREAMQLQPGRGIPARPRTVFLCEAVRGDDGDAAQESGGDRPLSMPPTATGPGADAAQAGSTTPTSRHTAVELACSRASWLRSTARRSNSSPRDSASRRHVSSSSRSRASPLNGAGKVPIRSEGVDVDVGSGPWDARRGDEAPALWSCLALRLAVLCLPASPRASASSRQ